MSYKPGDTVRKTFTTHDATGAATNADSLPTASVYRNGTLDAAVTVTVANLATGLYSAVCTLPSGYAAGDSVQVVVSATVGGVTASLSIDLGVLDSKRAGELVGSGADQVTVTITDSATSNPIADADVWVTADAAGTSVVAGTLQTNSQGKATFLLDAGTTYYLWAQKNGINSIAGTAFVAVAD